MNQLTTLKSIVSTISGLLESREFLECHRFPRRFVRTRILSMYNVVMFLLYSTRQAMHQNISRMIDLKPVCFPDVSKQAISKARQGIMPSLFKELFDVSVDVFSKSSIPKKLWHGQMACVLSIAFPPNRKKNSPFGDADIFLDHLSFNVRHPSCN